VRAVVIEESVAQFLIGGIVGLDAEGVPQKPGGAVAGEWAKLLNRHRRAALECKRMVGGGGEIGSGIDDRAVEIEKEKLSSHRSLSLSIKNETPERLAFRGFHRAPRRGAQRSAVRNY
jgi:hypothetical protein